MGDIVQGLSDFLAQGLRSDCHIIFHYPKIKNYTYLIDSLMDSFEIPKQYNVTYEVDLSWSTVHLETAIERYGKESYRCLTDSNKSKECLWFSGDYNHHSYHRFKKQWKGNSTGPILLALNHADFNKNHPIQEKFFSEKDNSALMSLVDGRKIVLLGEHYTFQNNILLIANCRYIVGIEGGWTHISHCMRAPMVIARNTRGAGKSSAVHRMHPKLVEVKTDKAFDFVSQTPPQHAIDIIANFTRN